MCGKTLGAGTSEQLWPTSIQNKATSASISEHPESRRSNWDWKTSGRGRSPCARVKEILQQRIKENRCKLEELKALQKRMECALNRWEEMPESMPQAETLCHLIESEEIEKHLTCARHPGVQHKSSTSQQQRNRVMV